jgi:oligoribonuclease (3'-5' exoribonuclease)
MNIHVQTQLHARFKAATAAQGKNMTDVLMEFIQKYVEQHLPEQLRGGGRK